MLGFVVDLRKLKATGKMRLRHMEVPVAGSMRRTLGGCVTVVAMMTVFIMILIAETGSNGATMEMWERGRFDKVQYVSFDQLEGSMVDHRPRLRSFGGSDTCQHLQDDVRVQYAQFSGAAHNGGEKTTLCSNVTDAPIRTFQISKDFDASRFRYSCKNETVKRIGSFKAGEHIGGQWTPVNDDNIVVMGCEAQISFPEPNSFTVSEARLWYLQNRPSHSFDSFEDPEYMILLTYRNASDPPNFYRVAQDDTFELKFDRSRTGYSQIFSVSEDYFHFVKDRNFLSYSDNALSLDCEDVSCIMKYKKSGLSNLTVATLLYMVQDIRGLQLILDLYFYREQGKIRVGNNSFGDKSSVASKGIELDGMTGMVAGTEVNLYSLTILASLILVALLAAVVNEIAKRKCWKWRGVDVTLYEQNQLLCKIFNDLRLRSDGKCLKNVKDLKFVVRSCEGGNEMRISVEEKEESMEKHDSQIKELKNGAE